MPAGTDLVGQHMHVFIGAGDRPLPVLGVGHKRPERPGGLAFGQCRLPHRENGVFPFGLGKAPDMDGIFLLQGLVRTEREGILPLGRGDEARVHVIIAQGLPGAVPTLGGDASQLTYLQAGTDDRAVELARQVPKLTSARLGRQLIAWMLRLG